MAWESALSPGSAGELWQKACLDLVRCQLHLLAELSILDAVGAPDLFETVLHRRSPWMSKRFKSCERLLRTDQPDVNVPEGSQ